jgi:hypothetical protein
MTRLLANLVTTIPNADGKVKENNKNKSFALDCTHKT